MDVGGRFLFESPCFLDTTSASCSSDQSSIDSEYTNIVKDSLMLSVGNMVKGKPIIEETEISRVGIQSYLNRAAF